MKQCCACFLGRSPVRHSVSWKHTDGAWLALEQWCLLPRYSICVATTDRVPHLFLTSQSLYDHLYLFPSTVPSPSLQVPSSRRIGFHLLVSTSMWWDFTVTPHQHMFHCWVTFITITNTSVCMTSPPRHHHPPSTLSSEKLSALGKCQKAWKELFAPWNPWNCVSRQLRALRFSRLGFSWNLFLNFFENYCI